MGEVPCLLQCGEGFLHFLHGIGGLIQQVALRIEPGIFQPARNCIKVLRYSSKLRFQLCFFHDVVASPTARILA
jgi:hypothetical protein